MEQKNDILDSALDGLVYQALDALNERDEEVRRMDTELSRATETLVTDTPLDVKTRAVINEYAGRLTSLCAKHYRHLYLQGAKDCVALLRELGVIQ